MSGQNMMLGGYTPKQSLAQAELRSFLVYGGIKGVAYPAD